MSYKINIHDFEGPLDLLLFFIQRDKLNIYDIPISKITKDFFDYISMLNQLNIEVGGDFIYMASLLMNINEPIERGESWGAEYLNRLDVGRHWVEGETMFRVDRGNMLFMHSGFRFVRRK